MKKILLLVTFFVGASAFARGGLRLDQPSALTCNPVSGKLVCFIQARPELTVTIDPDKSFSVGGGDQVKEDLKAAIDGNESSRITVCVAKPGSQFIAGILLTSKANSQNTFSIALAYEREPVGQPMAYLSPFQDPYTNLSSLSAAEACAIAFKEFNQ
jgi:hypothetical protein